MANDAEPTAEEMRDGLLKQLYDNRDGLKGIALVQALKALAALVPPPPPPVPEDEKPFSILDQLDSLPRAEGQKLLRREITRLRSELADMEDALVTTAEGGILRCLPSSGTEPSVTS